MTSSVEVIWHRNTHFPVLNELENHVFLTTCKQTLEQLAPQGVRKDLPSFGFVPWESSS